MGVFSNRQPEIDPRFLTRVDMGNDFCFSVRRADGLWYRVIPETAREVFYLQSLPKGIRLLVPEDGDGLLIRADSIPV